MYLVLGGVSLGEGMPFRDGKVGGRIRKGRRSANLALAFCLGIDGR